LPYPLHGVPHLKQLLGVVYVIMCLLNDTM
jgi:hypothetical protein